MPFKCKYHYKNSTISQQICEIIFNPQFSNLFEELHYIYRSSAIKEAEKEAFRDALYSFIAQNDQAQIFLNSASLF